MFSNVQGYEVSLQIAGFLAILSAMALWELTAPCRILIANRGRRWLTNIMFLVINTATLRLVGPLMAMGAAGWAGSHGVGLLNSLAAPGWVEIALGLLALDLALYGLHVALHRAPVLWRVHRVHHADRDVDVTTALRIHPIESLLSLLVKTGLAVSLGIAPVVIVIYEVLFNGLAMFHHGNVRLPRGLETLVRRVVVTPDMHRVHHSVAAPEQNSNYGVGLSVWDRLFGTYRAAPEAGHRGMTVGLDAERGPDADGLMWTLLLPFRR